MRTFFVVTALIAAIGSASPAEVDALITTAMKAATDELVPAFERASGHTVGVSYGPSGGIARRLVGGEPADMIMIDAGALEDLIRQGRVLPGRTEVARTAIGIAVRKGAPRPDVVVARGAQAHAAGGEIDRPYGAGRRRHHGRAHHAAVREARHYGRGDAQGQACGRGPGRPRQCAGREPGGRHRAAAGLGTDVQSRCR